MATFRHDALTRRRPYESPSRGRLCPDPDWITQLLVLFCVAFASSCVKNLGQRQVGLPSQGAGDVALAGSDDGGEDPRTVTVECIEAFDGAGIGLGGRGYFFPCALIPRAGEMPIAILVNGGGEDQLNLCVYEPGAPSIRLSSALVGAGNQFESPDFIRVADIDGDSIDDLLVFYVASELSHSPTAQLALVAVGSLTLAERWRQELFVDIPGAPKQASITPVSAAGAGAATELVIAGFQKWDGVSSSCICRVEVASPPRSVSAGVNRDWPSDPFHTTFLSSSKDESLGVMFCAARADGRLGLWTVQAHDSAKVWQRTVASYVNPVARIRVFATSDVNLQGTDDAIVWIGSRTERQRMLCIAGEDGSVVWESECVQADRSEVESILDVTGDGIDDLLVLQDGGSMLDTSTRLHIMSGSDGQCIASWRPAEPAVESLEYLVSCLGSDGTTWALVVGRTVGPDVSIRAWLVRVFGVDAPR